MTIKDLRKLYYRQRVQPETHELHISKGDSEEILREFHESCNISVPFDMFHDQVEGGEYDELFLKRTPMNFFSDRETGFVQLKKFIRILVDVNDERE